MPDDLNLGVLLFIPYRQMEQAVLSEMRRHGHDMPLSEARVFQRIGPEGSRMSDLARSAELSKQTTTSIVDRLERAGYVERRTDPSDARARLVTISAQGRELIRLTMPVVEEVEATWRRHLGARKFEQLRAILGELRSIADLESATARA